MMGGEIPVNAMEAISNYSEAPCENYGYSIKCSISNATLLHQFRRGRYFLERLKTLTEECRRCQFGPDKWVLMDKHHSSKGGRQCALYKPSSLGFQACFSFFSLPGILRSVFSSPFAGARSLALDTLNRNALVTLPHLYQKILDLVECTKTAESCSKITHKSCCPVKPS
jgi:hypothetical protein